MTARQIPTASDVLLRHVHATDELAACFPVVAQLRPGLINVADWVERASGMAAEGYRVLAAWQGDRVHACAGYRMMENLIHGHFLYVDDLVTAQTLRGAGLGAMLLAELTAIGRDHHCRRLVLDTGVANAAARRFYQREGLIEFAVGFVKTLSDA